MDISQAKFILSSYRPDGQDAQDADFAEALSMAAEDRELGEWLANERAQDAAFSTALKSVELPSGLREEILAAIHMDVENLEDPELDAAFFDAFAQVRPPEDLRSQIVVAMEREQKVVRGAFPIWKVLPVAAVAVLALSLIMVFSTKPVDDPASGGSLVERPAVVKPPVALDIQAIQLEVGQELRKNGIRLVSNTMQDSMDWLRTKQLPMAEVPEKLKSMKCIGASEFTMSSGAKASLVRFEDLTGKQVNMLVIDQKSVKESEGDRLPTCKVSCARDVKFCHCCEYWIARMQRQGFVVILLSQLDKEATAGIF